MIHPDTELRLVDEAIGYGVFATRSIPRGTLTWTLCQLDHVFTPRDVARLGEESLAVLKRYGYVDADGCTVLCWDFGRYINHSCEPTSLGVDQWNEVAVRDIGPGEQLTSEYGALNLVSPLDCLCGAPTCRSRIGHDDATRYAERWDAQVRAVLPDAARVAQPLRRFVRDVAALDAILSGRAGMPGHRSYVFQP